MLTEEQVHTAVARGIAFLNRTREPYGLWFMSMMHRLFGVPEYADALRRYDEVIATQQKEEAAVLRVLRRLNNTNNPTADWDYVKILTDQLLACALYCDRLGLPPEFAATLDKGVKAGGYAATHVLLAWIWLHDNGCRLTVRDGFVEDMFRAVAAILEDRPTIVNDLKLEAAAFLCMARQGKRVTSFLPTCRVDPENRRRLGQSSTLRTRPIPTNHLGTRRRSPVALAARGISRCAEARRREQKKLPHGGPLAPHPKSQSNRSNESGPALWESLCVS